LAAVTANLTSQQIRTMFVSMFPASACHVMAGTFLQAVNTAKLKAARKPVRSEYAFDIERAYEDPAFEEAVA
jgi:hypothetical protein